MFTYLNPDIRERLVSAGKLVRIRSNGSVIENKIAADDDALVINILGPIPLPLRFGGKSYSANWYASVRSTELNKVDRICLRRCRRPWR